jgi:hypothetical protein
MWELELGLFGDRSRSLGVQQVLSDRERLRYISEIQNLRIIQTSSKARVYSSGTYVAPERDAALVTEVSERHNSIGVISSKSGIEKLENAIGSLSKSAYYGNLLGSDRLENVDAGVILGSPHPGDEIIKKWCALAGYTAESNGRGMDKSYGYTGDKIFKHVREHQVLQALFRFARNGQGATVYVDTAAVPDWLPLNAGPEDVDVNVGCEKKKVILNTLRELSSARTSEIVQSAPLDISPQYVRNVLDDRRHNGDVSTRPASGDGRGGAKIYVDDGIGNVNPFGQVVLPKNRSGPRFSKLPHTNTQYARVSKEQGATEEERREEFELRKSRWMQQAKMQMWLERD